MTLTCTMKVKRKQPDFPRSGREQFWRMIIFQGKEREKTRVTLGRIAGSLQLPLVQIERTVTLSTSDNEVNKITPLYIMSKNGGNCSVNLKKNTKNFSEPLQCRVCPFRYHLYHHAQTVDLQGFTAILRCYSNGFPCFTLDKPLYYKGLQCFSLKSWEIH